MTDNYQYSGRWQAAGTSSVIQSYSAIGAATAAARVALLGACFFLAEFTLM